MISFKHPSIHPSSHCSEKQLNTKIQIIYISNAVMLSRIAWKYPLSGSTRTKNFLEDLNPKKNWIKKVPKTKNTKPNVIQRITSVFLGVFCDTAVFGKYSMILFVSNFFYYYIICAQYFFQTVHSIWKQMTLWNKYASYKFRFIWYIDKLLQACQAK